MTESTSNGDLLNTDKSKVLSCGKELTLSYTTRVPQENDFSKHCA